MEIFKVGINDGQYDGSRRFIWLADLCGLSVDLVSTAIVLTNFFYTRMSNVNVF